MPLKPPPVTPYLPPQPTFVVCPVCQALCLRGADGTHTTACYGLPHAEQCLARVALRETTSA